MPTVFFRTLSSAICPHQIGTDDGGVGNGGDAVDGVGDFNGDGVGIRFGREREDDFACRAQPFGERHFATMHVTLPASCETMTGSHWWQMVRRFW